MRPEAAAAATAEGETAAAGAEPGPTENAAQGDPAETDPAAQVADELALLGRMDPLERAMQHWGLEQRHILGAKIAPKEDGTVEVVIVTQGGQRVRWPQDAARVLSGMEKGDAVPHAQPGGIFKA